jgi:hypothetical protein
MSLWLMSEPATLSMWLQAQHTGNQNHPIVAPASLAARVDCSRVPEVVKVVVHERATVVLEVDPVAVAVGAVVLPVPQQRRWVSGA